MVELDIILDYAELQHPSWLLSPIEIISQSDPNIIFRGFITAEYFECINPDCIRAVFIIQPELPALPTDIPENITTSLETYPEIPHLSPSENTYWPINHPSELFISHIDNNSDHPISQGSLYNQLHTDPVTQINPAEHILSTANQNQFIISDADKSLGFIYQHNKILLNHHNFILLNNSGQTVLNTQKSLNYISHNNFTENTAQNYYLIIKNNFNTATTQGNIIYKTNKNITSTSNYSLIFNAKKIVDINTAILSLISDKNLNINSQKNITINTSGELDIQTGEELLITSENNIKIIINPNISIEILKSGVINFTAPQITITGQPMLSVAPTSPV